MRCDKFILRLYPLVWRQRYEEEVFALLELHPCSFLECVDLLFHALDAHLHPQLGTTGLSLNERMKHMHSLLRRSLLTIFCASLVFILAGIGLHQMTEYDNFQAAARTYSSVGFSSSLVEVGAFGVFLVVLLGGLPFVSTILQSAFTRKRYSTLFLLAIFSSGDHLALGWHLWLERSLFLGVLILAVIASAYALCLAVARTEIPEELLRFALLLSIPVTITMIGVLGAMLARLGAELAAQYSAPLQW